jgi:hypothetical protein
VNLSDGGTFQLERADRPQAGRELHIGGHDGAGGPGIPVPEPLGEASAQDAAGGGGAGPDPGEGDDPDHRHGRRHCHRHARQPALHVLIRTASAFINPSGARRYRQHRGGEGDKLLNDAYISPLGSGTGRGGGGVRPCSAPPVDVLARRVARFLPQSWRRISRGSPSWNRGSGSLGGLAVDVRDRPPATGKGAADHNILQEGP